MNYKILPKICMHKNTFIKHKCKDKETCHPIAIYIYPLQYQRNSHVLTQNDCTLNSVNKHRTVQIYYKYKNMHTLKTTSTLVRYISERNIKKYTLLI